MEFGITLFPDVTPVEKPAAQYFRESYDLVEAAERLGFTHVRSIEHYFTPYGGNSPSSILMLAGLARRTETMKLVTGAVIPAFNHPLKVAGEIGMLDAMSDGRLIVGFGRGFLPHEFRRFAVSRDDSISRFREGVEQVDLLLRGENVTSHGDFHSFEETTSYPRPTQTPRPPFMIAANTTADSYEYAGANGHGIMAVPMASERLRENLEIYRSAWSKAGHAGRGKVFLSFHMFVDRDPECARRTAGEHVEAYFKSLLEASKELDTEVSRDYKGYDRMREVFKSLTIDKLIENCAAWVGSPEQIRDQIDRYSAAIGGFDYASLQVNFHTMPADQVQKSLELFAAEVLPHFEFSVVAKA